MEKLQKIQGENPMEELVQPAQKPGKNHIKVIIAIIVPVCTLLVLYFGMVQYFKNRFYFGTEINCINASGKTVKAVKAAMVSELQAYTLKLKERGGRIEQIKGSDIGLKYNLDIERIKDSQDPYKWISACFVRNTGKDFKITVGFSFDEALLKKCLDNLSCFDSRNIIEPRNPTFKYINKSYIIVNEDRGNKVDKDILYFHVVRSILNGEREIDLESAGCYIEPQYNSKSEKIIKVKDTLNKYVSSEIIYDFGDRKVSVDGRIINKWLDVDENLEVIIDEEKVKEYIDVLSETYDTIGKTRTFKTSSGKTIKIGGGDYGWLIDKDEEVKSLIAAIKEVKTVERQPVYKQTALCRNKNDIGNTYVEIDLSKQRIWLYKNGLLVVQGNIVSGNVRKNHATPKGIYRLKYKKRNVVLRGDDYAVPVSYWMPFNGGIGIHDANWRRSFGGKIYMTNGSHGCINSPYNVAKKIFNNIVPGTPVVCY